jgi:uncharacterized caspase-like protein
MIDACHSEGVSGRRTRGVDTDQLVRELRESDAVVFTSSRSREFAQESEEWRHGAFTYAILKGLEGGADFFKDGIIKIKALDAFVSETRSNQLANGPRHGY